MPDVCLVQMPYSGLERPSIALGLLKAYLVNRGIAATVNYATFDFAALVGVDVYKAVEDTPAESLIGEWTFASAVFPEGTPGEAAFLDSIADRVNGYGWFRALRLLHRNVDARRLLKAVRGAAPQFTDAVALQVLARGPRIVGCTSTFQQHCASLALLRRIKELAPGVVTMIGGANCEGVMGETTHQEFPWLDFVMSGEVDAFFGSFCELILEQGVDVAARQAPEGVFGPRDRSRPRLRLIAPRAVLHSLDDAAVPDYDDYFADLGASPLHGHVAPMLLFESSRGCWWGMKHHCTFCGLNGNGMTFRSKSPARVLDELMTLQRRYGINWINAVDNIIDVKHVQTVLPELAARDDHPYLFYEVKANLKREQVRLLGRAGVRRIQPGIESLHDDVLKLLNKGNRWFTNVQLLKWAQESGITVFWNLLAGAPGESPEWYAEVADWLPKIWHLEPPGSDELSMIRYDRFSPYHDTPEQYGLDLVPKPAYRLVYPLPEPALAGLAYFFDDRQRSMDAAVSPPPYHALEQRVAEWRRAFAAHDAPRPQLTARACGGQLLIHDTRPIATCATLVIEGIERAILEACEGAQTMSGLVEALRAGERSEPITAVEAAVQRLKDLHLLLEWRGRILSLHVNEPVVPYLDSADCPGPVNLTALLRSRAPSAVIRDATLLPSELPLSEWLACAGA